MESCSKLESTLGYRFVHRDLLRQALTHPSYSHEHEHGMDNTFQRLEFLGDAALGLLTAEQFFRQYDDADEGRLTELRSRCTNTDALAHVADELDLASCLLLGGGLAQSLATIPTSILADAVEALFGAAWIDGGYSAVSVIFARVFAARLTELLSDPRHENPKGALQILSQKEFNQSPVYAIVAVTGSDHAPLYQARVEVSAHQAMGKGHSKQKAEQEAARAMLCQLGETESPLLT